METLFNMPTYKKVTYYFNPETGRYQKSAIQFHPYAVNSLPFELYREVTRGENIKSNAEEILTIPERKKDTHSRRCLTGLQPIPTIANGWYYGNHCRYYNGKKQLSDMLICFAENNSVMHIYLFSGYHKNTYSLRMQFAAQAIPHLLNA